MDKNLQISLNKILIPTQDIILEYGSRIIYFKIFINEKIRR